MNQLCFAPAVEGSAPGRHAPVLIEILPSGCLAVGLWLSSNGSLVAARFDDGKGLTRKRSAEDILVGLLHPRNEPDGQGWYFVAMSEEVAVNGITPLPVTRLDPGALVSIGQQFWMTTWHWTPVPVDAPVELANKPCPVCGGKLALAPAVECACGRWMHLERPEEPDDKDALNCYVEVRECGGCGRRTSLEPALIPEVPEKLADRLADEDAWEL